MNDKELATATMATRHPIVPRKVELDFAGVPKHWLGGQPLPTHMVNGVNLLFPFGERFFVRSVYHFADRIADDGLREAIKGFGGQEGRHAKAHEDYFDTLRAQGYEIDRFLAFYTAVAEWVVRICSPELRLAMTAAAEHFTALMAEGVHVDALLPHAHPVMRRLIYWHAAEELEHKSVAYDVLQAVDSSYRTRLAGLAISTVMLASMWWVGTRNFLRQDGIGPLKAIRQLRGLRELRRESIVFHVFVRGIRQYLRRDFHPDDCNNYALAAVMLAKADAAV